MNVLFKIPEEKKKKVVPTRTERRGKKHQIWLDVVEDSVGLAVGFRM